MIGLKLMYAKSQLERRYENTVNGILKLMNDDKLLNYTPTLSKVIFPKSLERIDSKHHLLCPSFHKKQMEKTTVFPLDFGNGSVRHLGTVQTLKTAKHQKSE